MYKIDPSDNKILKLKERSFAQLGFRERDHLQEWIAKEPGVLREEFLIIQKEFSGFSETQERLDLLALDKQGALVVIENKLDDSGRDVTWQALKYASYCSSLSKENIRKIFQDYLDKTSSEDRADEKLSEFFDDTEYDDINLNKGVTQRIILIAANFRKEVTSTVLWLLNYKVRLQCFRATPYSMGEELFLTVDQIIPTQDAEDYMISMAEKAQDDIDAQTEKKHLAQVRQEFWRRLLELINQKTTLYQNISPGTQGWISAGSGLRGAGLNFVAGKSFARVELYIDRGDKEENEFIFGQLFASRSKIEQQFGGKMVWQRLDEKRACRIKWEQPGNVLDRDQWEPMMTAMVDAMTRLEQALKEPLQEVNLQLKSWSA